MLFSLGHSKRKVMFQKITNAGHHLRKLIASVIFRWSEIRPKNQQTQHDSGIVPLFHSPAPGRWGSGARKPGEIEMCLVCDGETVINHLGN